MKRSYQTSLTAERLRELLNYDPETGIFRWRVNRGNIKAGTVTGCLCKRRGYLLIGIDGIVHLAHRLAWLWMTGEWPSEQVDHRNGVRNDNRFANLREATHTENCHNLGKSKLNKSGYTGVFYWATRDVFIARIGLGGRSLFLGYFDTAEKARDVRLAAKARLHPFQPTPRDA